MCFEQTKRRTLHFPGRRKKGKLNEKEINTFKQNTYGGCSQLKMLIAGAIKKTSFLLINKNHTEPDRRLKSCLHLRIKQQINSSDQDTGSFLRFRPFVLHSGAQHLSDGRKRFASLSSCDTAVLQKYGRLDTVPSITGRWHLGPNLHRAGDSQYVQSKHLLNLPLTASLSSH